MASVRKTEFGRESNRAMLKGLSSTVDVAQLGECLACRGPGFDPQLCIKQAGWYRLVPGGGRNISSRSLGYTASSRPVHATGP